MYLKQAPRRHAPSPKCRYRKRLRRDLKRWPDGHSVVAKPLEAVSISSPIVNRPGTSSIGMVVRPAFVDIHPQHRGSGSRSFPSSIG